MSDENEKQAPFGALVEVALSNTVEAANASDLRRMAQGWKEALIVNEAQFSDPEWDDVHRLMLLADEMESAS